MNSFGSIECVLYQIENKMNNQSNSKFYVGDCACEKKTSITNLAIQCEYCINCHDSQYYDNTCHQCSCLNVKVVNYICNTCAKLRDEIDELHEELDKTVFQMVDEIKQFSECREKLEHINTISIKLRQMNRKLLENIIPSP